MTFSPRPRGKARHTWLDDRARGRGTRPSRARGSGAEGAAHTRARLEVRVEGVWRPIGTVALSSTGAYAKLVAASGERTYRVILAGPELAPDAAAVTRAMEIDPGR